MRLFLVLLCTFSLLLSNAFSVQTKTSSIEVKDTVPKGVVITKEKAIAKRGYIFEKQSNTRAISRMRGGSGGITGEFDCTCNGEQGGCSVVTTPNSVTCASSGCNSCYMIVTIPDKASNTLH